MSTIESSLNPSVGELLERYQAACTLRQPVNAAKIRVHLGIWAGQITGVQLPVDLVHTLDSARKADQANIIPWSRRAIEMVWALRAGRRFWKDLCGREAPPGRIGVDLDGWAIGIDRVTRSFRAWPAPDPPLPWHEAGTVSPTRAEAERAARDIRLSSADTAVRLVSEDYLGQRIDTLYASWGALQAIDALAAGNRPLFLIWRPLFEAFEAGAFTLWLTRNEVVASTVPSLVRLDDEGDLHAERGPALSWLGMEAYLWHGVHVSPQGAHLLQNPKTITCDDIDREPNAEVRRMLIERYGVSRYLLEDGGRLISEVGPYRLYRKNVSDQEPLVMVRLVNATPERDGSRKEYWLRVPPNIQDALEAVAWTFGLRRDEYNPGFET